MVEYNRETGLFEHEIYSTVNPRESRIIRERLKEAKIPFKVYETDVLLHNGRGLRDTICVVAENIKELEKYIEEAKKIVEEFLREEEEKEKLAEELNKKLSS